MPLQADRQPQLASKKGLRPEQFFVRQEPETRPSAAFFERRFFEPYRKEMQRILGDIPTAMKGEGYVFSSTANALDMVSPHEISSETFPPSVGLRLLETVQAILQRKNEISRVRYLPDYVRTVETFFPGVLDTQPRTCADIDLFTQELQRKTADFSPPNTNMQVYYQYAYALRVLAPERAQEMQVNRESFDLFKDEVDAESQKVPDQYGLWQKVISHYARLAIVHPQWKGELQLDPKIGKQRDDFFEYIAAEAGVIRCIELLEKLAIIDAAEIHIPARGHIRLSRYDDSQSVLTPLPPQIEY